MRCFMYFAKWYRVIEAYKNDFDFEVILRMMRDKDLSDKELYELVRILRKYV